MSGQKEIIEDEQIFMNDKRNKYLLNHEALNKSNKKISSLGEDKFLLMWNKYSLRGTNIY
jgi:hypothetical protein